MALVCHPSVEAATTDDARNYAAWYDGGLALGMLACSPVDEYASLRASFFDQALLEHTHEYGVRQVVLLSSGLDTRAFRLPWPTGTAVYEVDSGEALAYKAGLLEALPPTCARRVCVPAEPAAEWLARLTAAGFAPELPAVFLADGLAGYLVEAGVVRLLDCVHALCHSPASRLLIDLPTAGAASPAYAWFASIDDSEATFACDDPYHFLSEHGWTVDVSANGGPFLCCTRC
eukprot:TRINITY_DN13066_c0_g1_i1.p2 TRINITY_DN13066_c0_g1~~TRINITY_DN13066_c0_g1_i1.p2  ORF type:complete len:239 (-),score=62.57 TRINITY_DN13066_c0_g1_i1:96-791(-)